MTLWQAQGLHCGYYCVWHLRCQDETLGWLEGGTVWTWWGGRTSQTIQTIQTIRTSRTVWMGWTIRAFGVESGEGGMSVFFGIGCLRVGLLLI